MKRMLMLCLCIGLLFALVVPAAATPVSDLTILARYFPEKTVFFASMRTDDAYIDSLDALLERILDAVPEADLGGRTLRSALNDAVDDNPNLDGTFDELIRPWLGNTAAVGVPSTTELFDDEPSNDRNTPVLFAAEITDRAAAEAFFEGVISGDAEMSVESIPDYTLYMAAAQDDGESGAIYIGNEVLLITNEPALLPQPEFSALLDESEDFNRSLSYLPETDYNAIAYITLPEILNSILLAAELEPEEAAAISMIAPVMDAVGGQVIGATVLDERSITLDYVQPIISLEPYEALGINVPTDYAPVSYDFARFIPAGTPFVIQGTDLQTVYENGISNLMSSMAAMQSDFASEDSESVAAEIEEGLEQVEVAVRGFTGLDLNEDILGWMTGNYALAFRLSPALSDLSSISDVPSQFPLDFSLLIEATDPEAAQAVVDGLAQAAGAFAGDDLELSAEAVGDTTAQMITVPATDDMPFPIEFVFGASEEVFVIGTPRMAEAALDPDEGLADDPGYIEMQSYALDNAVNLYYLAGEGLTPLVRLLVLSNSINSWDEEGVANVFRLVSSSSFSSVIQENGTSINRIVLTLPEGE